MTPFGFGVLVALAASSSASAAPPEIYREVASVHWAVRDLQRVKAAWAQLGFPSRDLGEVTVASSYRGRSGSARVRAARARFGDVDVVWIQPLDGANAFSEHLARHGEGVVSLNYRVSSAEALGRELARLSSLGVGVLQKAEVPVAGGLLTLVYMDTAPRGRYVLGLVHGPTPAASAQPAGTPVPVKLAQYAFVVSSLQEVSDYWARLGFPPMEVTHPLLTELRYRGAPGRFDQKLGWHRHGTIAWEWIEPVQGPTVYRDFQKAHGEGFHHFAFDLRDIDAAAAGWEALGAKVVQSGAWGEKGKPGSGRFAYLDTDAIGGVMVELLWSFR